MKRYLIVGDGVAGARAAIKIKETDPKAEVHLFTEEAFPFYYRVRFPGIGRWGGLDQRHRDP